MWDWVYTLARVLLPVLFIVEGVGQMANMGAFADKLQKSNVPFQIELEMHGAHRFLIIGYLAALIEIAAGLMLMIGYKTRVAALVLVPFTLGTIFIGHPFWLMEGAMRAINFTDALKNLSIVAGLLLVAAKGPGAHALDSRHRRY
jgi:putative oxidoreductase